MFIFDANHSLPSHCKIKKVRGLVFENFIKMVSRSILLASFKLRIKDDHAYKFAVKVSDDLFLHDWARQQA